MTPCIYLTRVYYRYSYNKSKAINFQINKKIPTSLQSAEVGKTRPTFYTRNYFSIFLQ